jgi:hypothetical protein
MAIAPTQLVDEFLKTTPIEKYKRIVKTTCIGNVEYYDLITFIKDYNEWLSQQPIKTTT